MDVRSGLPRQGSARGARQAAGSGPGPREERRGHRCPGRRIPPPAPPGPAWAGRRYLGAGGWGRAAARGALSTRINGGARRGPGRGAAGRGARGAAPRGVLPCGALSTLPERARSSCELRPAQLPANLRVQSSPCPAPPRNFAPICARASQARSLTLAVLLRFTPAAPRSAPSLPGLTPSLCALGTRRVASLETRRWPQSLLHTITSRLYSEFPWLLELAATALALAW